MSVSRKHSLSKSWSLGASDDGKNVARGMQDGTSSEISMQHEVCTLLKLSFPSVTHSILAFGMATMVLLFVGQLGAVPLSIASLASSFFYLTGASIAIGLTMGIDTLCGQANGAGNKTMAYSILRRAICVCTVASLLVGAMWTQAEWIFIRLGQNAEIAKHAARYLQLLMPYLLLDVLFICQSKFLTSQGIVQPMTTASIIAICLAAPISWILIFKTNLAIHGAPASLFVVSCIALITLRWLSKDLNPSLEKLSPVKWLNDGFMDWKQYLKTAVPGLATICSEWWCYEVFTLLAGILPNATITLGIMGASNSLLNMIFIFGIGLSSASSIRIANLLGAGRERAAKQAAWIALSMSLAVETTVVIVISVLSKPMSRLWFHQNEAAVMLCQSVLPIVALTEWGAGISYVLTGIFRACDRMPYGLLANVTAYWLLGVPLGLLFGFYWKRGVQGFWIGLALAAMSQCVTLFILFLKLDFHLETERARKLTA